MCLGEIVHSLPRCIYIYTRYVPVILPHTHPRLVGIYCQPKRPGKRLDKQIPFDNKIIDKNDDLWVVVLFPLTVTVFTFLVGDTHKPSFAIELYPLLKLEACP